MKAIVFQAPETLIYTDVAAPVIVDDHDAVIQVQLAGLCGSDLHIYHGRETGLDPGTVMGHEFVGKVVETGSAVKEFQVGDSVCSPFTANCGACFYCDQGLTARCPAGKGFFGWVSNGQGLQGTQAEFVRVPLADSTLMHLPQELSPKEAILFGDNLVTGFFCADMAEVREKGVYAVIGCGVVGLMAIVACRLRGAEQIVAVDTQQYRLQHAKEMGASHATTPDDALALIHELTEGRGADAVLEAVGLPQAQQLAMEIVRPGGILAVVGMHTAEHFAFSPFDAYNRNLTYKTGRCSARYYMDKIAPQLNEIKPFLRNVFSHQMPLSEGVRAYEISANKLEQSLKITLKP